MKKRVEKNKEIIREIEEEKIKDKGKKILKITLWILIPLLLLTSFSFIILRYVGNIGIVVREYAIEDKDINEDLNGLKIIHFSCIHYNKYTDNNKISKLVKMINNTNPDIVIFTGDLIDSKYDLKKEEREFIIKELKSINSNIGKYAIKGEDKDNVKDIYDSSNFTFLSNISENIYINNSIINLLAFDDEYNKESILINEDANYYITLVHKPDQSNEILDYYKSNLILSAHSHNGQIHLPLIENLLKKEGSKIYYEPHYKINDTELYITGGLGNNGMPLRLFNHPSINFYRLRTIK